MQLEGQVKESALGKRLFDKLYILLLNKLNEKELSGYEIMKMLKSDTIFWKPSTGSTYPLLASLLKKGIIGFKKRPGKRNKKVYFLTRKGVSLLKSLRNEKWLREKCIGEIMRNLIILKNLELIKQEKIESIKKKLLQRE